MPLGCLQGSGRASLVRPGFFPPQLSGLYRRLSMSTWGLSVKPSEAELYRKVGDGTQDNRCQSCTRYTPAAANSLSQLPCSPLPHFPPCQPPSPSSPSPSPRQLPSEDADGPTPPFGQRVKPTHPRRRLPLPARAPLPRAILAGEGGGCRPRLPSIPQNHTFRMTEISSATLQRTCRVQSLLFDPVPKTSYLPSFWYRVE